MRVWKRVGELAVGDISQEDIAVSSTGEPVVSVGQQITDEIIEGLRALGIKWLLVESQDTAESGLPNPKTVELLKSDVMEIFDGVLSENKVNVSKVAQSAEKLTEEIFESYGDYIVPVMAVMKELSEYTYTHEVNVSIMTVLMAVEMGYSKEQILNICSGALVHDVGKLKVPPEILHARRRLSDVEFLEIKKHVVYGKEICLSSGITSKTILSIVEDHHEKVDGLGYVKGLKGEEISEAAKLVAVADVYDALISERPYKHAQSGHKAISHMLSLAGVHFDVRALNALIRVFGLYPLGTRILLSSGEEGTVIGMRRGYLSRPVVRLSSGEVVDLSEEKSLLIQKVLS
ncbi:MAG: HD-GYP domain-containing protein [Thermotogae bacterium]|nr:HD-GYP domain-containing protein [Thermotogota bacterium]